MRRLLPLVLPVVLRFFAVAWLGAACAQAGAAAQAAEGPKAPDAAKAQGAPQALEAPAAERRIEVQRYEVQGATLIPRARLVSALEPLRGPRTLAELRLAAGTVQRLYAEAGWGGVIAYLPPQAVQDGTVTIAVIEGRVSTVTVGGAKDAAGEAAVRAAVPALQSGRTPHLGLIDRQIQLANDNPARQIRLLLRPGERPAEVAAELSLRQRDPRQVTISADDTGSERTGRWRLGVAWQHADLSGAGDVASLQYQTAPGRIGDVSVFSAAYSRPLPALLTSVQAYALLSDIDAGAAATAAGAVRINGRGRVAGLRAQRHLPRLGDADPRIAIALERREYVNRCDVEGLPGACAGADAEVLAVPVTVEFALRSVGARPWAASAAYTRSTGWGGGRASAGSFAALRPGADPRFGALRLGGAIGTSLGGAAGAGWQAQLRGNLQWTRDALISGEQFGLGGVASVRGYEEREVVGDRGAVIALDLLGPEWLERAQPGSPSLRGLWFADAGRVSNRLATPCRLEATGCSLAGTGLGIAVEGGGWSARLLLARALRDGTFTARGDTRAHVAASYTF